MTPPDVMDDQHGFGVMNRYPIHPRTGDWSAGRTLTLFCICAPGDLSPVLIPDTAEGEPCSSSGQVSICFSDKRQGHPAALFSEHRRQIRVRVMAFRCYGKARGSVTCARHKSRVQSQPTATHERSEA